MSDVGPPRADRRRTASLPRQAAEGIGIVTLLAVGGVAFGLVVSVVVSWIF